MNAILFLLALLAFIIWGLLRRRGSRRPNEILYRDELNAPTLTSSRYRLAGRPDYVWRKRGSLVPVEVKSRACGNRGPYPGERAQLLAYCLLIEEEYGEAVSYGELEYRDRIIRITFGARERQEIAGLLETMDAVREAHRSHNQAGRCRSCGFRTLCDEALT